MKTKIVSMENFSVTDSGRYGKALEESLTRRPCKKAGVTDWRHNGVRYEIKSGGGELGNTGRKVLKGCHKIIYIPVPQVIDGCMDIRKQEGFIVDRLVFLETLKEVGLYKTSKVSSKGDLKESIETFYVMSKQKWHGAKGPKLIDKLYEVCEMTLEDFLEDDE